MCCLFGLIDHHNRLSGKQKGKIIRALSVAEEARGTDAAGIAYNTGGQLTVYKRPGPAHKTRFYIPQDARVIMGHTRMTTQGNAKFVQNNHPFLGHVPGTRFALAHNGVLYNDHQLRTKHQLPSTNIQTDSYVAVQLIERQKALSPASLKQMAEWVEGSFVFTLLDERDNLTFVKGDNPLLLLHLPREDLYLYASTPQILSAALKKTWLRICQASELQVEAGDILTLSSDGTTQRTHFVYRTPLPLYQRQFWNWPEDKRTKSTRSDTWYLQQLRQMAAFYGYTPEDVDQLLADGWSTDEIEDAIYGYYDAF